jgi:hypothetical protein
MSATTYVIPKESMGPRRRLRRTDDLHDHLPEPEEDLPDRSSAESLIRS